MAGLAYTLHTGVRHCKGSVGSQIQDALKSGATGQIRDARCRPKLGLGLA